MKIKNILTLIVSLMLIFSIVVNLGGCSLKFDTDLEEDTAPSKVKRINDIYDGNVAASDFALRLFRESMSEGENSLISPMSILYAIAMAANGADGKTRKQIEEAVGMSVDDMNSYLSGYISSLPKSQKDRFTGEDCYILNIANSLWINKSGNFSAKQEFIQAVTDYYSADVFNESFDEGTLADINEWVNTNTNGIIPGILDSISPDDMLYLINAIGFEATWANDYGINEVDKGTFYNEDGTEVRVDMMFKKEYLYLTDDNAKGFVKYCSENKYAFVAILPDKEISVYDYLASLDGESLSDMLSGVSSEEVETMIPKFKVEYSSSMADVLKEMGIINAFDSSKADFSNMSDSDFHISDVIHKAKIELDDLGVKAGASTAEVFAVGIPDDTPRDYKYVYLDRPFVYMIIDCENNVPLFIGTITNLNN